MKEGEKQPEETKLYWAWETHTHLGCDEELHQEKELHKGEETYWFPHTSRGTHVHAHAHKHMKVVIT